MKSSTDILFKRVKYLPSLQHLNIHKCCHSKLECKILPSLRLSTFAAELNTGLSQMARVSAHGMQRTRFREDGQKQERLQVRARSHGNESRHTVWGACGKAVSNPDGPNQLTAPRQDSRHLALKPTQV